MKAFKHSTSAIKDANWAAQLVESIPVSENIDIGLLHYFVFARCQHRKPDGKAYSNTIEDFAFLRNACEKAACMGLVPYQRFGRNSSLVYPQCVLTPDCSDTYQQRVRVFKRMFDRFCRSYVQTMVAKTMPVHVEIWLENSLSVSLIKPIAQKYNVNFIASSKSISVASIFQFARRIANSAVPIRVLLLSDYDPDCVNMSKITIQKTMMMIDQLIGKGKVGIELDHLMLTAEQCAEFQLPAMACSGKIELNAMEAQQPDYIRENIEGYLDWYIDLEVVKRSKIDIESAVSKMLPRLNEVIDSNRSMTEMMKQAERFST